MAGENETPVILARKKPATYWNSTEQSMTPLTQRLNYWIFVVTNRKIPENPSQGSGWAVRQGSMSQLCPQADSFSQVQRPALTRKHMWFAWPVSFSSLGHKARRKAAVLLLIPSVTHIKGQWTVAEGCVEHPCSFSVLHLQDKEITTMSLAFVQGEKSFLTILSL